jgi:methionine-rich copper-binding protein CopC
VQLTVEGYLRRGVEAAFEHMKMKTNEIERRTNTQQITMTVLLNLSQAVNLLFSQIMSVGSEASSMSTSSPSKVLMSVY